MKLVGRALAAVALLAGSALAALSVRVRTVAERSILAPAAGLENRPSPEGATRTEVEEGPFVGAFIAERSADLAAIAEGRVAAVAVRLGDRVHANDIVAALDTRAIERQLAVAKATHDAALAEAGQAKVELARTQSALARRSALHQEGLASGEDLDKARFDADLAASKEDVARAHADEAGARLAQVEQQAREMYVRAPFDGTIAARYVDPGSLVRPSTPLLRLIDHASLRLRFAVSRDLAERLPVGRAVRAQTSSGELRGTIDHVAPEVDGAAQLVFVEATLSDPPEERAALFAGDVARVFVGHDGR
jgi:RND family efflux transporter MFP subunit